MKCFVRPRTKTHRTIARSCVLETTVEQHATSSAIGHKPTAITGAGCRVWGTVVVVVVIVCSSSGIRSSL